MPKAPSPLAFIMALVLSHITACKSAGTDLNTKTGCMWAPQGGAEHGQWQRRGARLQGSISFSGSSVSETRMVSPRPSMSSEPMPIALFMRPSSPSPACRPQHARVGDRVCTFAGQCWPCIGDCV